MKNILYLHTHDLGRCLSPYGYPAPAPELERLAGSGVLFRKAFSVAPTCSPSRAGILTGRYPHQCGMYGLTNQGWTIDPRTHLAFHLGRNGFHTATICNDHVYESPGGDPREIWSEVMNHHRLQGDFDRWHVGEMAADWIRQAPEKPFFLSVGWDVTHRSKWEMVEEFTREEMGEIDDRYVSPHPLFPDSPTSRREAALQARTVAFLDRQIGLVMKALRESGLEKDTLVIFVTDHGPGLPDMKKDLLDFGTGTALIFSGSGFLGGGRVVDAMVSQLDVYPTVCEALGVSMPEGLEGKSMLPLLAGKVGQLHDEIYLEQNYHGEAVPLRAIRTERYKYIRHFGEKQCYGEFRVDGGPVHDLWKAAGRESLAYPEEQFYDLLLDPLERVNRVESASPELLRALRAQLEAWQNRTGDPLRNGGKLPEPPLSQGRVS